MIELTLNTAVTVTVGLILGGVFSYAVAKYKGQKEMAKCTEGRLVNIEKQIELFKVSQFRSQRREIVNTYRFYKSKKKIPLYEMQEVEDIYKEYSEFDDNGIIKKFMEQMRTWTISEDKE